MTSCHNYCNCHWETGAKRHICNRNSFVHSRCVSNLLLCKKSAETSNFCKTSLVCFQVWSSEIQSWETGLFLWVFTNENQGIRLIQFPFWRIVETLPWIHPGLLRLQDGAPSYSVPLSCSRPEHLSMQSLLFPRLAA